MTKKVQKLRAFFYMIESEWFDENTPDEWFMPQFKSEVDEKVRDLDEISQFEQGCESLLFKLYNRQTDTNLDSMDPEEIQFYFYEVAKNTFGEDKKSILQFFQMLYLLLFEKKQGPRWGVFVSLVGVKNFRLLLERRLKDPFN